MIAREFIENYFTSEYCTVKKVTEFVKLDRTYLFRLFKNDVGMSVQEFFNRCRIAKASTMLMASNHTIKTVAYSVGITDQLYFSKLFKKYRGVSPSVYRKEKQSGAKIADSIENNGI